MSLKHGLQPRLLVCVKKLRLDLKLLAHKPQAKFLTSECTNWWCFNSCAVQKHFGHSLQTYGFTSLCRCMCSLKCWLLLNFFWQMLQVSQVPSLCDSSRCRFSWWNHIKSSEQYLHECGCTSVNTYMKSHFTVCLKHHSTIRTLIRSSVAVYTTHMSLQVA